MFIRPHLSSRLDGVRILYTVLRCDIGILRGGDHGWIEIRVWGLEFHVNRIANSYSQMMAKEETILDDSKALLTNISNAIQRTHDVLEVLIKDAK